MRETVQHSVFDTISFDGRNRRKWERAELVENFPRVNPLEGSRPLMRFETLW